MVTMSAFLLMAKQVQEKLTLWYDEREVLLHYFNLFLFKNEWLLMLTSSFFIQTGPRDLTEHSQGVNYRALRDLFILAEQRKDTFRYDVSVQMIEIYNEQVRDLLNSDGLNRRYPFHYYSLLKTKKRKYNLSPYLNFSSTSSFTRSTLEIRNSSQTGLSVPDASLVRVSSTSDIIDLMNIGQRNRAVGATALNDRSSRSHRWVSEG